MNFEEARRNPDFYRSNFEAMDRLGGLLGGRAISIDRTEAVYEYDVNPGHYNPNGILHGGALYTVMDSSQGFFIHFILDEKFSFAATGTSTIRYEAPVTEGTVRIRTFLDRQEGRKYFVKSVALQGAKTVATLDEIWIAIQK